MLTIIYVCIMVPLIIAALVSVSKQTKAHLRAMESISLDFIKTMKMIHQTSQILVPNSSKDVIIKYLVQHKKQKIWHRLFNRTCIHLYVCEYAIGDKTCEEHSYYSLTIPNKQLFYLTMMNHIETEDREKALDGLKYLKCDRVLP